jgi:hypothetical protein
MRKFAIVTVVATATALPLIGGTTVSHASAGPGCHEFGGAQGGIRNCSLQSLEAYRFEIQGNGGSCSPNPRWHGNQPNRRTAEPGGLYPWPVR